MDYLSYLQNPTKRSPRADVVLPYFYPLTATGLGDRLNFIPSTDPSVHRPMSQVGNVKPYSKFPRFSEELAMFGGQLRMSDGHSGPDPDLSDYFYMDNTNSSAPNGWFISASATIPNPSDRYYWAATVEGANPGTAGQNIRLVNMYGGSPAIQSAYDKVACYSPGASDPYDGNVTFQDSSNRNLQACKWRTDLEVFGCCSSTPAQASDPDIIQRCAANVSDGGSGGFMPNGKGHLCVDFMLGICENNWDQDYCAAYLQSFENGVGNSDVLTVFQDATANYINNMAAKTGCGYNDYTSVALGNSCKMPSGKMRDDSKDTFINGTLVNFCKTNPGKFDNLLNQYCGQFTRSDLDGDDTFLQSLCGCHLSDGSDIAPGSTPLHLHNPRQEHNQYAYPGVTTACDPLCAYAGTIQSSATPCSQTVCIMDNIGVNMINSHCNQGINITQVCGASFKGGPTTGDCYMSNVDIDLINSSCGYERIAQYCNTCFTYDPENPAAATQVTCPTAPGGGGGGGVNGGGSSEGFFAWIKKNPLYVAGFVLLFAIMLGIILFFSFRKTDEDLV